MIKRYSIILEVDTTTNEKKIISQKEIKEENLETILSGDANQPAKDGLDGYTLWKQETNQPNATYNDYISYLRQPISEFINSINFDYENGTLTITTI